MTDSGRNGSLVASLETLWRGGVLTLLAVGCFFAAMVWFRLGSTEAMVRQLTVRIAAVEIVAMKDLTPQERAALMAALKDIQGG